MFAFFPPHVRKDTVLPFAILVMFLSLSTDTVHAECFTSFPDGEFVIPNGTTEIKIEAQGADGGTTSDSEGNIIRGGEGAFVSGVFAVTPGQTLKVVIGERGSDLAWPNGAGGGGGGSGVYEGQASILVAGGGGGASSDGPGGGGRIDYPALPTANGGGGDGGSGIPEIRGGGGGGGFHDNGSDGTGGGGPGINAIGGAAGKGLLEGDGEGGSSGSINGGNGGDGVGGGGEGALSTGPPDDGPVSKGGGGGGFEGGDGAGFDDLGNGIPSSGGSSYNFGAQKIAIAGVTGLANSQDGAVKICVVSADVPALSVRGLIVLAIALLLLGTAVAIKSKRLFA